MYKGIIKNAYITHFNCLEELISIIPPPSVQPFPLHFMLHVLLKDQRKVLCTA